MVFVAKLANGKKIPGFIPNDLGYGFSPVDGSAWSTRRRQSWGR